MMSLKQTLHGVKIMANFYYAFCLGCNWHGPKCVDKDQAYDVLTDHLLTKTHREGR